MPASRFPVAALPTVAWLLLAASCVSYDAAPLALDELARSTPTLPDDAALSFPAAVAFALQHNPELRQLTAAARAAGLDAPATELQGQYQGDRRMLAAMVDPVALLGLGPRGAAQGLADARAAEAAAALAVARWRMIGRLAELYAADTALAQLPSPEFDVDAAPFVQAGLASPQSAAQARAAAAGAAAERRAITIERQLLRHELGPLLGLGKDQPITLMPIEPDWPELPTDQALHRRPDLALALARYTTADAEFRRAVADQYPALMIGPEAPLRGGMIDVMAWLRLPLFATAAARATRERRTAEQAAVHGALLAAEHDAESSRDRLVQAAAQVEAAQASAEASAQALRAAAVAVEVEIDAFERLAERAQMAVRDAVERRLATVDAARARVRLAVARGWPAADLSEAP